jgi:hypothetical protein
MAASELNVQPQVAQASASVEQAIKTTSGSVQAAQRWFNFIAGSSLGALVLQQGRSKE